MPGATKVKTSEFAGHMIDNMDAGDCWQKRDSGLDHRGSGRAIRVSDVLCDAPVVKMF